MKGVALDQVVLEDPGYATGPGSAHSGKGVPRWQDWPGIRIRSVDDLTGSIIVYPFDVYPISV